MQYETVTYFKVELTVGFELNGKHYPATRETPEEFPDVIINEITAKDSDIDLLPMLNEDQVDDLCNLIHDKL